MWLCESKLEVKKAHFRLPSARQKRACLSSLIPLGVSNGPIQLKSARKIWPLLELLAKIR